MKSDAKRGSDAGRVLPHAVLAGAISLAVGVLSIAGGLALGYPPAAVLAFSTALIFFTTTVVNLVINALSAKNGIGGGTARPSEPPAPAGSPDR